MPSGIELKKIQSTVRGEAAAEYEIWHQDGKMILKETLKVHVRNGQGAACAIEISGCCASTVEDSLDKLADWLARLSETLKNRTKSDVNVPLY